MLLVNSVQLNVRHNVQHVPSVHNRHLTPVSMGTDMDAEITMRIDEAGMATLRLIMDKFKGDFDAYMRYQFEQRVEEEILVRMTKGLL